MKTKIVIVSLLAVFMLVMLPSISAVEFKTVNDAKKEKIDMLINKIQNNEKCKELGIDIDKIKNLIGSWEMLFLIFTLIWLVILVIIEILS